MRVQHTIDHNGYFRQDGEDGPVPWWSFTKLVLATSALSLVEGGRIALDAPIDRADYTLRQLLQHESGLPDYGWLEDYHAAVAAGGPAWAPEELVERTKRAFPPKLPGSGWAYSNIGYYEVGQILVEATGLALADSLSKLVLAPAGLEQTRLARHPRDLEQVQMGDQSGYDPRWVLHGLLVGPLQEAAQFLHRLLSGTVLGEAMLTEMFRVHQFPQFRSALWEHPSYGLGIMGGWDGPGSPSGGGPGSSIAVYGCTASAGVKVSAVWQSGVTGEDVERTALGALRSL